MSLWIGEDYDGFILMGDDFMKHVKTMLLSLVLCISMLPCSMLVSAEEEQLVYQDGAFESENDRFTLPYSFEEYLKMDDETIIERSGMSDDDKMTFESLRAYEGLPISIFFKTQLIDVSAYGDDNYEYENLKKDLCERLNIPKNVVKWVTIHDESIGLSPSEDEYMGYEGKYVYNKLLTFLYYCPDVYNVILDYPGSQPTIFGDFNGDGIVNASDASVILVYAAEYGAGTFTGTFEEYVNR